MLQKHAQLVTLFPNHLWSNNEGEICFSPNYIHRVHVEHFASSINANLASSDCHHFICHANEARSNWEGLRVDPEKPRVGGQASPSWQGGENHSKMPSVEGALRRISFVALHNGGTFPCPLSIGIPTQHFCIAQVVVGAMRRGTAKPRSPSANMDRDV